MKRNGEQQQLESASPISTESASPISTYRSQVPATRMQRATALHPLEIPVDTLWTNPATFLNTPLGTPLERPLGQTPAQPPRLHIVLHEGVIRVPAERAREVLGGHRVLCKLHRAAGPRKSRKPTSCDDESDRKGMMRLAHSARILSFAHSALRHNHILFLMPGA